MILNTTPTVKIKQNILSEYESVIITFKNPKNGVQLEKEPTSEDSIFYVNFTQKELSLLGVGAIYFEIQYFYNDNTSSNIEVNGRLFIQGSFSTGVVSGSGGIDADTIYSAEVISETVEGNVGVDGKSAYEIAVENGFSGSETEWLESLKGDTGATGQDGTNGADFPYEVITEAEYDALTDYDDKLYVIIEAVSE